MRLCSGCHRHIRDAVCPFCQTEGVATTSMKSKLMVGLKRTAVVAAVASLGACITAVPAYGIPVDSGNDAQGNDTSVTPAYGIPVDAATNDTGSTEDASSNDANMNDAPVAAYGIPPGDSGTGGDR